MKTGFDEATDSETHSTIEPGRVYGFDVARAIAILGMVIVHFSLVMSSDHGGTGWLNAMLEFLDGRAAATFVILAGIGVTLMSQRAIRSTEPDAIARARRVLIRRGICLLVLGFVNLRIWPGDILRVYGVSLVVASRLVTASSRWLLLSALGCVAGFFVLLVVLDYEQNWDWSTMTYHRLWTTTGLLRNLFYDGFRSVFPWSGFLFFGMWLGRLDLRNPAMNLRVFCVSAGTVLIAEFLSWLCVSYLLVHAQGMDAETIKALFGTGSMPPLPLFLLASGGTAVSCIALCVRLADAWPACLRPLADTGQLALTWYFAHIVLGLGTIVALGMVNSQPLWVGATCGVSFFILAVLISWIWKRFFKHGPLEWILRLVAG